MSIRAEQEELKDLRLCCRERSHREHTERIPAVKITRKIVDVTEYASCSSMVRGKFHAGHGVQWQLNECFNLFLKGIPTELKVRSCLCGYTGDLLHHVTILSKQLRNYK